ncbi:unnamed protein product [Owenia fusiformis]|uniref:Translin-associated factor X n=1 Tax=Owenia fusiformis TaxID=6347 RepID=A0A8J1U4E7_OWEFU|nr:unnamed protein product [Owenia fusiformis]
MPGNRNRSGKAPKDGQTHGEDSNTDINLVDESSPIIQAFKQYQNELDTKHDKHERLVKLSRDVTLESKRVIFLLQRIAGGTDENKNNVLKEADTKLQAIQDDHFRKIALELDGEDPYQFLKAYTAGMQEYIEAVTFFQYHKDQSLTNHLTIQRQLQFTQNCPTDETSNSTLPNVENPKLPKLDIQDQPVKPLDSASCESSYHDSQISAIKTIEVLVTPLDYILGVADLTGEIMRLAINSVKTGNANFLFQLCDFMREIHNAFISFGNIHREIRRKLNVLQQSLKKVETACYTLQIRGSEIPKHMLADVLSGKTMDGPVYRDFDQDEPQDQ